MGASRESVTSNNFSECILDMLKPANVFLCGAKKQRIGVQSSQAGSSLVKRRRP